MKSQFGTYRHYCVQVRLSQHHSGCALQVSDTMADGSTMMVH